MSAYLKRSSGLTSSTADISQKELLVSQLKAEILELKQNEREYYELSTQLKKLEQRYHLLQEEKNRSEADFKNRNTINFDTIANLRTDVDTLKRNISDAKTDLQDLRGESQALKDIAEQKGNEVQRHKSELTEASQHNESLSDARRRLEAELEIAREEKRKLLLQVKDAKDNLGGMNYKNNELEKTMKEIEYSNNKVERQNTQLQQAIDSANSELRSRSENLEVIEHQVGDSQKTILALEKDIRDASSEVDQNRAESVQKQKAYQQEVSRNLELTAKAAVSENGLNAREAELEELKRGYDNLKAAHSSLLDTNFQLKQDLDGVRNEIDAISAQNTEVIDELDRLTMEDEQVRSILNRQTRVESLKHKSEVQLKESQLRKSGYKPNKNHFSPSPDRNLSRSSPGYK